MKILLISLLSVLTFSFVNAQCIYVTSKAGNWSSSSTWGGVGSTGGGACGSKPPGSYSDKDFKVIINHNVSSNNGIAYKGTVAIELNADLSFNGEFFAVDGNADITVNLNGNTLSVNSVKLNNGASFTASGSGLLDVSGNVEVSSSGAALTVENLEVGGNVEVHGGSTLETISSGHVDIDGKLFLHGGNAGATFNGSLTAARTQIDGGSLTLNGVSDLGDFKVQGGVTTGTSTSVSHTGIDHSGSGSVCAYTVKDDVEDLKTTFDLTSCATALPIELINFEVEYIDGQFMFQWETMSEYESDYFEIQYGTNLKQFSPVGSVAGAGTSYSSIVYNYEIDDLDVGANEVVYFRLKQVDYDLQFATSNIIAVNVVKDIDTELVLFPNPASDIVHIELNNVSDYVVEIYSVLSYEIEKSVSLTSNNSSIDVSDLVPGMYFVKVNGIASYSKLIVE